MYCVHRVSARPATMRSMRPHTPALLLLIACGPPPEDSADPSTGTTTGTTPGSPAGSLPTGTPTGLAPQAVPEIAFDGPVASVDPGPDTHHATVTYGPDGRPWIAYQAGDDVRVRILGEPVFHDSAPVAFDHPQLASAGDRVIGLSTLGSGGLNASVWGSDGTSLGPPVWLDATIGGWPDLGLSDDEGVAAWTEGDRIGCAHLGERLATHTPVPCPGPLDPVKAVSTLAVDFTAEGGWLAWSEATLGTQATVALARLGPSGGSSPVAVRTVVHPGYDARPDVVVTPGGGGLLAWRGSDSPVTPSSAWLAAFTDPTDPLVPVPLGGEGSDRPDLAVAGPLAAVAWDQPDGVWLQWVDPATAALLGEPVLVATAQEPLRANLALRQTDAGWVGVVSWEAWVSEWREVRTRTFTASL